jgi:hypothetical protein
MGLQALDSAPADSPEPKWPSRGADSPGSALTDLPGSIRAAPERVWRRPGSRDWLRAPRRSRVQTESLGSAPARPLQGEAARRARLQTKPAASCDRTRHEARRASCAPQTDSLCTLRLPICRRRQNIAALALTFCPLRRLRHKSKGRPEGRPLGGRECVLAFTRCRVRADCSETAGSRRPQGRIHRAP